MLLMLFVGLVIPARGASRDISAVQNDTARIDTSETLHEITVMGNRKKHVQMRTSVSNVIVGHDELMNNFSGSLMQSLSNVPGVKAMSIGSGQSKPSIRGLGFNRMVVAEDGIKHEGQQWGDDHGLEIDQFAVDRVEIIKGPAALTYGSDAIGGVINLYTNSVPTQPFQGSASVFGRSNNVSVGVSANLGGRTGNFYWRANATTIDYADSRVPTDSIEYYSYRIALKDRMLRNMAGKEMDGSLTVGYLGYRFHTDLRISDSYAKSGFFANAHGLEVRLSNIDYDRSSRDINLPFHDVNHLKIMSHSVYMAPRFTLEANAAYQKNDRREESEPVSHGYMPQPATTLERRFVKHTLTGQLKFMMPVTEHHDLTAGVNAEYQHNRRSGWGFIIPDFETFTIGAYVYDRWTIRKDLIVNAGLRYDYARTRIHSYNDWFKTPVAAGDSVFKLRSADAARNMNSVTWSAGVNYSVGAWLLKANVGKSFRLPIPKELGADGVNYHIFRYEQGNPDLDPEQAYQLDAGITWTHHTLSVELNPYINYFPNYIYMNPTPDYYEGLQLYHYTQSRVLRYGFEAQATWRMLPYLELGAKGEYLYAEQLSGEKKGYTLPFSTPWSIDTELKYLFDRDAAQEGFVTLGVNVTGAQHRIVPPEKITPGHVTLNMTAGKKFRLGRHALNVSLNADNLLNTRYFDHTSYYRLMDIPEPGRNVALMITMIF